MKVKHLIKRLQLYNGDLDVFIGKNTYRSITLMETTPRATAPRKLIITAPDTKQYLVKFRVDAWSKTVQAFGVPEPKAEQRGPLTLWGIAITNPKDTFSRREGRLWAFTHLVESFPRPLRTAAWKEYRRVFPQDGLSDKRTSRN